MTVVSMSTKTLLSRVNSATLIRVLRANQEEVQGVAVTVDLAQRLGAPRLFLSLSEVCSRSDATAPMACSAAFVSAPGHPITLDRREAGREIA
jgi:hypothetical protein